jgi:hypothetical protein
MTVETAVILLNGMVSRSHGSSLQREAAMGRSNFMLQFMLDTSLSDAEKFPLKVPDQVVTSVNPTDAPDAVVWCVCREDYW